MIFLARTERLKKLVEKKKKPDKKKKERELLKVKEIGELKGEEREVYDKEISRIVERLKRKKPIEKKEVEEKIAAVTMQVGGAPIKKKLNLKKVRFTPEQGGFANFAGKFYNIFSLPLRFSAKFTSNLPLARSLRKDLDSANMPFIVEQYLVMCVVAGTIFGALSFVLSYLFFADILSVSKMIGLDFEGYKIMGTIVDLSIPMLFGLIASLFITIIMLMIPASTAKQRGVKITKQLPFGLRHLATQIQAGAGLHASMRSIANAGYGPLSEEFNKVLLEMERGASTQEALKNLGMRVRSTPLKKAVNQIIRAITSGGNLSKIISGMAEDISFELTMSIRDYTEKLNLIGVVYIMIGVVAPVVLAILAAVTQIPVFGRAVSFEMVVMIYIAIIGMLGLLMYFTKRIQP